MALCEAIECKLEFDFQQFFKTPDEHVASIVESAQESISFLHKGLVEKSILFLSKKQKDLLD